MATTTMNATKAAEYRRGDHLLADGRTGLICGVRPGGTVLVRWDDGSVGVLDPARIDAIIREERGA